MFPGRRAAHFPAQIALNGAAIDPRDCLLFSERQYREREARNAAGCRFSFIPLPFDPDATIEWSPVWSLTRQEVRYVPTALAYYDYPLPQDQLFCDACSNGTARAILSRKRSSRGSWSWSTRQRGSVVVQPRASARRGPRELWRTVLRAAARFPPPAWRDYWVVDLTADLGIPVFASMSSSLRGPHEQIVFGFGLISMFRSLCCAPSPR